MPHTIIYRERYGVSGHSTIYVRNPRGEGTLVQLSNGLVTPPRKSLFSSSINFVKEVFLPQGYPESVRADYLSYQIWDTVQAFCSTISGILTTHAILESVGVGDASATALSATITWVLKDGIGMIGRIMFAWWRGHALDTDAKKWRLFADFLNDAAMFLELLLLPIYPLHSTPILCATTSMKGIVGVAAGASRASITQHHALRGNNGDVSAKDGSQETCVNLVASTVGMALLSYTQSNMMVWLVFLMVTSLHLFANYKAVKSLGLVTFNSERLCHYLRSYIVYEDVLSPSQVNQQESVIVGISYKERDLCGFTFHLGYSVRQVVERDRVHTDYLLVLSDAFKHRPYLLVPDAERHTICVLLHPSATTQHILKAYFHSALLALTICYLQNSQLDILKDLTKSSILCRLEQGLKRLKSVSFSNETSLKCPFEAISVTDDIIDKEFLKFFEGVKREGWSTERHSLQVEEWRGVWWGSELREAGKDE